MIEGLQSLKTAYDLAKEAKAISDKYNDSSLKLILANMQNEIADSQLEAVDLKKRIVALEGELAVFRGLTAPKPEVIRRGDLIYRKVGEQEEGPFCSVCYGTSGDTKFIPVQRLNGEFAMFGTHSCGICKTTFGKGTGGAMRGLHG